MWPLAPQACKCVEGMQGYQIPEDLFVLDASYGCERPRRLQAAVSSLAVSKTLAITNSRAPAKKRGCGALILRASQA